MDFVLRDSSINDVLFTIGVSTGTAIRAGSILGFHRNIFATTFGTVKAIRRELKIAKY